MDGHFMLAYGPALPPEKTHTIACSDTVWTCSCGPVCLEGYFTPTDYGSTSGVIQMPTNPMYATAAAADGYISIPVTGDEFNEFLELAMRSGERGPATLPPVVDLDMDTPVRPVFVVIEIGPFGRPEHCGRLFTDTWSDLDGDTLFREIKVPEEPFTIESVGRTIYRWYGDRGEWFGSELIRRQRDDIV